MQFPPSHPEPQLTASNPARILPPGSKRTLLRAEVWTAEGRAGATFYLPCYQDAVQCNSSWDERVGGEADLRARPDVCKSSVGIVGVHVSERRKVRRENMVRECLPNDGPGWGWDRLGWQIERCGRLTGSIQACGWSGLEELVSSLDCIA
jgi:hypothetical protein